MAGTSASSAKPPAEPSTKSEEAIASIAGSHPHFFYEGQLTGHRDWVTCLAAPRDFDVDRKPGTICLISGSRDKTLMVWQWQSEPGKPVAAVHRRLEGHSGFVSDVACSSNGSHAVSASWDKSLRIWDAKTATCLRKCSDGHPKDVVSVGMSMDDRLIFTGSRDGKWRLFNTLGALKYTQSAQGHTDWISSIVCTPKMAPITPGSTVLGPDKFVTGGWDGLVICWCTKEFEPLFTMNGHTGPVTSVAISPDGTLCASGSRDGFIRCWDLEQKGEALKHITLPVGEPITKVCFCPTQFWIAAATENSIVVWDLAVKECIAVLVPETQRKNIRPSCNCIVWSADGRLLFSGYSDNTIRIWGVR